MSKYTAEQVPHMLRKAAKDTVNPQYRRKFNEAADIIDAILRERESVVTELPRYTEWRHLREKGVWSNGVPAWAKDHEGRMNDYRAAVAVIDELAAALLRESAKAAVTDEIVMLARRPVFDAGEHIEWHTMRSALEAVAPMLASAQVPDARKLRLNGNVRQQSYDQGWNACRDAMLAASPKPEAEE